MNKNRNIFALDGITGMLIATLLLLSILVGLTIWSFSVQKANSKNFYKLENPSSIQMFNKDSAKHIVDVKVVEK